jgi:hypothetical protein
VIFVTAVSAPPNGLSRRNYLRFAAPRFGDVRRRLKADSRGVRVAMDGKEHTKIWPPRGLSCASGKAGGDNPAFE